MKFKDFKRLSERRVDLISLIERLQQSKSPRLAIKKYKQELMDINKTINPNGLLVNKFKIQKDLFIKTVSKFFIDKHINFVLEDNNDNSCYSVLVLKLLEEDKKYILARVSYKEKTVDLDYLFYPKDSSELFILTQDFPEINDIFWNLILKTQTKEKTERVSLLKKMIKKNNQELKKTNNIEFVNKTTKQLMEENDKYSQEIKEISKELYEIKI